MTLLENHSDSLKEYELNRLRALHEYDILDTLPEEEFDALTRLASEITGTPISSINLVDETRQWSKSTHGIESTVFSLPRKKTICQYAVSEARQIEIKNLIEDQRFQQVSYVRGDSGLRYYLGSPLITPAGYAIGSLCVLDYEERSLSDSQKHQLSILADEVMARLELRKKNKRLEELNSFKSRMMKMLSHDMRTPLNGIIGITSLMQEMKYSDDSEYDEMLDLIEQSSRQLQNMIEEIMSYTMIESGGFTLDLEPTTLAHILEDIKMLYTPSAKTKGISLLFITKNADQPVALDSDKVEQILGNLVSNAIKFSNPGGEVTVAARTVKQDDAQQVELRVTDDGIGMEQEVADTLFDQPAASRKGTRGEKSTGIGLDIVKNFVELHNGTVAVESRPGKGSTFTVSIPV
ncbi:MAG: ATP-binding protein [Balneolaceae bacterium]